VSEKLVSQSLAATEERERKSGKGEKTRERERERKGQKRGTDGGEKGEGQCRRK